MDPEGPQAPKERKHRGTAAKIKAPCRVAAAPFSFQPERVMAALYRNSGWRQVQGMNIIARIPTTLSSREFNQNTSAAKKAAEKGPVFITDRGKPAHVLLTIEEYRRLKGNSISLAEALEQKDAPDVDIELPEYPRRRSLRAPDSS